MNRFPVDEYLATELASNEGSLVTSVPAKDRSGLGRITFVLILLFYAVYFLRPGDLVPALTQVPIAKILGIMALLTLALGIASRAIRWTREITLLLLFLLYLSVCIPFAIWKGGAFETVMYGAAKAILIPIAAIGVLTRVDRLKKLLLVQTLAMVVLAGASISHYSDGRMFGVGTMFGDPNELALDICIVLPVCIAMFMIQRGIFARLFWLAATALFILAIVLTFSRGGFLALLVLCIAIPWRFRFSLKSLLLIFGLGVAMVLGAVTVAGSSSYVERIKSITNPEADTSGSSSYRQELLMASIKTTFEHPVFGVGPGQFMQVSGSWHQSHNTYTQISAEAGIPALILYLILMWTTVRNLASAKSLKTRTPLWYMAAAVHCGILSYFVGGTFLSTAYWFIPYLLVAYGAAVSKLAENERLLEEQVATSLERGSA